MQNLAQAPANTVCPVCGMPTDDTVAAVIAVLTDDAQGDADVRMGACGAPHRAILACRPDRYATAALSNQIQSSSSADS